MHDFQPEDMTTFVVEPRQAFVFYEDIRHIEPTAIKGAYFVDNGETGPVNTFVQDPDKTIIYKRTKETQGLIEFTTTIPGQYAFIVSNLDAGSQKYVTLALHTNEVVPEPI